MSEIAVSRPDSRGGARLAPYAPMLWAQTGAEFLKLWRTPAFTISSLALPVVFFSFFGLPNADHLQDGVKIGRYLLASFGAYGVLSVMLFSFGVGVATERGQRMTVLMRATPLRPSVFLLAKVLTALAFALCTLVILFIFAAIVGGVRMDALTWATLTVRLLIGALPFIALGFAIGYLAGPNSAAPITQLLFLVLSFASGLFVPLDQLPSVVQKIAPYLPTYRYGQLGWSAIGANTSPLRDSVLWLVGYTVIFAAVALRAYRREDTKQFG